MLESTRHSENKELYKQRRKESISSNICQYLVRAVNSAPGWGRLKHNFITVHGTPAQLLPSSLCGRPRSRSVLFTIAITDSESGRGLPPCCHRHTRHPALRCSRHPLITQTPRDSGKQPCSFRRVFTQNTLTSSTDSAVQAITVLV